MAQRGFRGVLGRPLYGPAQQFQKCARVDQGNAARDARNSDDIHRCSQDKAARDRAPHSGLSPQQQPFTRLRRVDLQQRRAGSPHAPLPIERSGNGRRQGLLCDDERFCRASSQRSGNERELHSGCRGALREFSTREKVPDQGPELVPGAMGLSDRPSQLPPGLQSGSA